MTTIVYYPEKENRRASRRFLFDSNDVEINPGQNEIENEIAKKLISLRTVKDLIDQDIIIIKQPLVSKKAVVLEIPKQEIDEDEDEDDEE